MSTATAAKSAGKADSVVYLSNLPYEVTEPAIRKAFQDEKIAVSKVQLLKKGSFNRTHNSGLATVVLDKPGDIETSCKQLDGKLIHGRPMIVRKNKFEADQPGYISSSAGDKGEVALQTAEGADNGY